MNKPPSDSQKTIISNLEYNILIGSHFIFILQVAFHALRYAAPIRELGNRFARRMWIEGPYIALHLRLEKDVWVRTGCLTGLGPEYDGIISKIGESQPEYLTGRQNMSYLQRRLAGQCPLNALEMAR